jgi:hypothetical protein
MSALPPKADIPSSQSVLEVEKVRRDCERLYCKDVFAGGGDLVACFVLAQNLVFDPMQSHGLQHLGQETTSWLDRRNRRRDPWLDGQADEMQSGADQAARKRNG